MSSTILTHTSLLDAVAHLAAVDADLARVVDRYGPPPLWDRPQGFGTLLYIILEQQVSLASARAAYNRLAAAVVPLEPQGFLTLDDAALKAIGFSRQKTLYARELAQAVLRGELDLARLADLPDALVVQELVKRKGIGQWSAEIYLMEALLRPDVWPVGDLALVNAVRRVKGLDAPPGLIQLEAIGALYRPWRSVAARIFWHFYLNEPHAK